MLTWLAPALVLVGVILVHELGHFLAAKLCGVYTPRFAIFFGRPLFRRRFGETEYVLGWLPLGGYVKMAARGDEDVAFLEGGTIEPAKETQAAGPDWDPDAMKPFGPKEIPANRWFEDKPLAQRVFILLAGVIMNVLLAIALWTGLTWKNGRVTVPSTAVGGVGDVPKLPVVKQLLGVGDTIVAVNGREVREWGALQDAVLRSEGTGLVIRTRRGEVSLAAGPPMSEIRQQIAGALAFYVPPVVSTVMPSSPASRAGLAAGDSVVAVGGEPVRSFFDMAQRISASPGRPLALTVSRGGAQRVLSVVPDSASVDQGPRGRRVIGRIGVVPRDVTVRTPVGFGESVREGVTTAGTASTLVFDALRRLVTRRASRDEIGGPIAIIQASARAGGLGIQYVLDLMALISINVAIMNLLPIPVLDGAAVLLNVAESVKGSPINPRARERILLAGVAFLVLLFAFLIVNDTRRLFGQ